MNHLIIYRMYFTEADCYKSGIRQKPCGVQVHSTWADNPYLKRYVGPDDGRLGENVNNNHHNRPGLTVCANAYIGRLNDGTVAVYQALPWDMRCWLSGKGPNGNANKLGYIGFEIAEDKKDESYFYDAVMNKSVLLTAHLCELYGIDPFGTVRDHKELHSAGFASDHMDIWHWLKIYGLTMDDYRAAVDKAIKEGVTVEYIDAKPVDHPTLRRGSSGEAVKELQTLLNKNGYSLKTDGIFGAKTEAAVIDYQKKHGLKDDGIVGAVTWASLWASLDPMETTTPAPTPDPDDNIVVSRNELASIRKILEQGIAWINEKMEG